MRVKLTARTVETLTSPEGPQTDYFDTDPRYPGLCLRVSKTGRRTFYVFYRSPTRNRTVTRGKSVGEEVRKLVKYKLGRFPMVTLAQARDKAKAALRLVDDGFDPSEQRAKEQKKRQEALTFKTLCDVYVTDYAKEKKRSWKLDQGNIKNRLVPIWGSWRAEDITRADVKDLFREISKSSPVMANRILALVSKIFSWAVQEDKLEANPCTGIERNEEKPSERQLTEDEMRAFWGGTEALTPVFKALFRLRLLTAQRGAEIAQMEWSQLHELDGALWWDLPAAAAKTKEGHRVPLSPQVVRELGVLKGLSDGPWVFPKRDGSGHVTRTSDALTQLQKQCGFHFHLRDLRRTAATMMRSLKVPRIVVSKVLNHSEGKSMTAVYDRYSCDPEKKDALDKLGRKIDAIVAGKLDSNVLEFTK